MAITLASDALSDAEITDGIGLGDLGSAARLWVRHWPTALTAARLYVGADEVPGLAAEALIATVSAIAIGRGPREDVTGFVTEAVRELGEDDEPSTPGAEHPPVFVSPMMTTAFGELDAELQQTLRTAVAVGRLDDDGLRTLTVLQHFYLAEHTDRAETKACRRAHIAMMSVADSAATEGVPGATWLHMSTCAWCTEAFHEVAFSNVALGSLIDRSVLDAPPAAAISDPIADDVVEPVAEPELEATGVSFADVFADQSEDDEEAEDDDVAALATGAAHAGGRRGRLIAIGIAAAAAVSVLGVILVGQNDDGTSPTGAGTGSTQGALTGGPTTDDSTGAPSEAVPSGFAQVAGPRLTPTSAAPKTAKATATAKPTAAKPTATHSASSAPSPTTAPTTAPPTPTPTPTPTPPPTPAPCNALQHLFGLC